MQRSSTSQIQKSGIRATYTCLCISNSEPVPEDVTVHEYLTVSEDAALPEAGLPYPISQVAMVSNLTPQRS